MIHKINNDTRVNIPPFAASDPISPGTRVSQRKNKMNDAPKNKSTEEKQHKYGKKHMVPH